jgi:hypothetical protein
MAYPDYMTLFKLRINYIKVTFEQGLLKPPFVLNQWYLHLLVRRTIGLLHLSTPHLLIHLVNKLFTSDFAHKSHYHS